jgi:hypothetical protein
MTDNAISVCPASMAASFSSLSHPADLDTLQCAPVVQLDRLFNPLDFSPGSPRSLSGTRAAFNLRSTSAEFSLTPTSCVFRNVVPEDRSSAVYVASPAARSQRSARPALTPLDLPGGGSRPPATTTETIPEEESSLQPNLHHSPLRAASVSGAQGASRQPAAAVTFTRFTASPLSATSCHTDSRATTCVTDFVRTPRFDATPLLMPAACAPLPLVDASEDGLSSRAISAPGSPFGSAGSRCPHPHRRIRCGDSAAVSTPLSTNPFNVSLESQGSTAGAQRGDRQHHSDASHEHVTPWI